MSRMPGISVCVVAVVVLAATGCSADPPATAPSPLPASAAAPAPAAGRHGGRVTDNGGGGGTTTASWPAGVPLPSGTVQQVSAAGGLYMATVLVGSGLTTACSDAVGRYRDAGWSAQDPAVNTATDPTVLRGPAYVATVVCTAADHSPSETLVSVHLRPT